MNSLLRKHPLTYTIILVLAACGADKSKAPQAPPPTLVSVYEVHTGNATFYDIYPATVTALNQIDIRPQVGGYITGIYFTDGQQVTKGQKLYTIDEQLYNANYQQAVANLNVSKSNLAKAQQDADRYNDLAKNDAIAKQVLDHALADLQAAKMQLKASEAAVNSVQTNLKYATIYAPLSGTIGISQVKLGTAVTPGNTVLNTVSTEDPIAVDIAVDQSLIPKFANLAAQKSSSTDSTFTVTLPDGSIYDQVGKIAFLDRAVDPQTATIKARLIFPNPKKILKVGVTCNVRVQNKNAANTLLIPYKAVVEQLGENFVFVLDGSRVLQHKVTLGNKIDDKIVVLTGLQEGDKVVTEGVQKLRDSSMVQVGKPKAPASK
ncbi:efflux RND transporter periplasmic adaptor subunit [Parasediminibacterium paludis]|uniref:Efflux RND transporter periplasmic adaptor subunit n=1 Tax=Parasediminibacterium paludis TaxID=908966 RepID=A0ABV8PZJ5_9BACT